MGDRKETFDREYVKTDHRSIWIDRRKWRAFDDFLLSVRGKADTVVIAAPEVLGDTYREFVLNLAALGDAGLKLEIAPSATRGEGVAKVTWDDKGDRQVIVERTPLPMMTNKPEAQPDKEGWRTGISVLRRGKQPIIVLQSSGPDMVYCQAELLLKYEKEEYKPSSLGRAIAGVYAFGSATLDEFLHEYSKNDQDLEAIERFRLSIMRQGWDSFVIVDKDAEPYIEKVRNKTKESV